MNQIPTKLIDKSAINRLTLLFATAYMVSYITRINFGAVISAMEISTGISRSLLSMSITGSFITYGAGQIVSGVLGDRFSPKKLVAFGLMLTTAMNIIMSTLNNPFVMLVIWCINGFAQSFMWPPMVRLMTAKLTDLQFKKTNEKVQWGSSVGTIVVYTAAPFWVSFFSFRAMFLFSAVCGGIMLAFWLRFCEDIPAEKRIKGEAYSDMPKAPVRLFGILMISIMVAIVIMGMIRDAVTTWLPTYLLDTYGWDNASSILSGVVLPLFAIVSFSISTWLYQNKIKNPLTGAMIFFGVGFLSAIGWGALSGVSAVGSIVCAALLTGSMHGVNLMLICMVPKAFDKYGNVSTVSGIINACTYIGSAISTFGIGALSESEGFGWSFNLGLWIGSTLVATIICLTCIFPWKKKFMDSDR